MSVGIARAIMGTDEDRQDYIDRETLLAAVQRTCVCAASGKILDISDSVLVTATFPSGHVSTMCVYGGHWDAREATVREGLAARKATIEVIDGRWYTKAGTRCKNAPPR